MVVHRAVGRPGVVLVGEGAPSRVGNLLAQEKKKVSRFVPDVPVYEVQAGDEAGHRRAGAAAIGTRPVEADPGDGGEEVGC